MIIFFNCTLRGTCYRHSVITHSMQRVVWISKQHWLKPGPMTYMGLLNAQGFAEHGIPTDFFVRAEAHYDAAQTEQDIINFYGLTPHPLLKVHCIAEQKSWQRQVYQAAIAQIKQYYAQHDSLLIATREYGALSVLLRLKKSLPTLKVLYESHNFFINQRHLDKRWFSFSRLRTRWVERHILPKADGLICLTEHQRALYQHWFPQLATIALPLGCLSFPPCPNLEQRRLKRQVVYIGHLYDYKGLELFFALATQLKDHAITLHIIGGFPEEVTRLQQRAEQEKLSDVLQFTAFIEPKRLHDFLSREASIGLVPLQDTFYNRYLTCPVKVLDFLAHGLPIVTSELPSVRDIVRDHAGYCPSQDVSEFANKIKQLLNNAELYHAMSDKTYQRAQALQWQQRAQHIIDFAYAH
jgi:glycosyltransferase involved in cell wall biosynthesis